MPRLGEQTQPHSCVAESLLDNPNFIHVRFHIGQFITVSVNTEAERENIKLFYASLETTSAQINAPIHLLARN
jgi:hypothetical protein